MSERDEYVAGLRALADWLEGNEVEVPAFHRQRLLLSLATNADVEQFADKHNATVQFDREGNASCDLSFGPVTYHAYSYADFQLHLSRQEERRARGWADQNGMEIVPAAPSVPQQRGEA